MTELTGITGTGIPQDMYFVVTNTDETDRYGNSNILYERQGDVGFKAVGTFDSSTGTIKLST